jgi:hypothetical protein
MAGLDGALARPDVPVFPQAGVAHLGLLRPFRGVADSHQAAESLLDADHGAVHPVVPDMVDAIPEDRRGLPVQMDEAAGKSAAHEPRLADAVPDHPDPAWVLFPERLAWSVLEKSLAQQRAAAARCKPDAGRFAA